MEIIRPVKTQLPPWTWVCERGEQRVGAGHTADIHCLLLTAATTVPRAFSLSCTKATLLEKLIALVAEEEAMVPNNKSIAAGVGYIDMARAIGILGNSLADELALVGCFGRSTPKRNEASQAQEGAHFFRCQKLWQIKITLCPPIPRL